MSDIEFRDSVCSVGTGLFSTCSIGSLALASIDYVTGGVLSLTFAVMARGCYVSCTNEFSRAAGAAGALAPAFAAGVGYLVHHDALTGDHGQDRGQVEEPLVLQPDDQRTSSQLIARDGSTGAEYQLPVSPA